MVMNKRNSKLQEDMIYGQRYMLVTTPDADMKENRDYFLEGGLGIAHRRRRFSVDKYGEISIRYKRASGAKTEYQKILDGECKSQLFVFEFLDAWIICTLTDILNCLKMNKGYAKSNNDGITSAYYINLRDIKHLIIRRQEK